MVIFISTAVFIRKRRDNHGLSQDNQPFDFRWESERTNDGRTIQLERAYIQSGSSALASFSAREDAENTGVYFLLGKDNHLNKAHVKYLEYEFYQAAKAAGRFVVTNITIPTRSSVSEYDAAMLQEFIDHTKLLVNTLGCL